MLWRLSRTLFIYVYWTSICRCGIILIATLSVRANILVYFLFVCLLCSNGRRKKTGPPLWKWLYLAKESSVYQKLSVNLCLSIFYGSHNQSVLSSGWRCESRPNRTSATTLYNIVFYIGIQMIRNHVVDTKYIDL